jgi:hypothetical protein
LVFSSGNFWFEKLSCRPRGTGDHFSVGFLFKLDFSFGNYRAVLVHDNQF